MGYAKSAQIRAIRSKMTTIMTELGTKGDFKSLVKELISAPIGENIAREASSIFPIKDCHSQGKGIEETQVRRYRTHGMAQCRRDRCRRCWQARRSRKGNRTCWIGR